jgi:RNA polymerase sigma factor (sigma-70 family)
MTSMGILTLEDLLMRARSGDKAAEQKIFERLLVRFTLIAKRRIDGDDAQDIAQEACMTILEKYRTEAPAGRFEAWAHGVLYNKIGNFYQHRDVRRTWHAGVRAYEPASVSEPGLEHDLRRQLLECLRKLICGNRRYARALNLVSQGFGTDEICQRLAVQPGYLYVILNRGRKMLTECLKKDMIP